MKKLHAIPASDMGPASVITYMLSQGPFLSLYHPRSRIAALSEYSTYTQTSTPARSFSFSDKEKDVKVGRHETLSFKAMSILARWVRPHYVSGAMKHDRTQLYLKSLQREMQSLTIPSEGTLRRLHVIKKGHLESRAASTTHAGSER